MGDNLDFASDNVINQRLAQLFKLVDLGVDGGNDSINLRGFRVEICSDGGLFFFWRVKKRCIENETLI